jgi:DNA-binding CsgD family transcriptional regulator
MDSAILGALRAAFNEFKAGFVIAREDGGVLFANAAAQEMIDAATPIRLRDGVLRGESEKATEALRKGLRQAAGADPASSFCVDVCLRACDEGAAIATLKALRPVGGGARAVAIVVTRIEALDGCGAHAGVAQCYGLTAAETRTLRHFVGGGGVAEAALAFQVSQNTVKSHLQNIYAKTKVPRQPHLIQLVNRLCPPLKCGEPLNTPAALT